MRFALAFVWTITATIPAFAQAPPTPIRDAVDGAVSAVARTLPPEPPQTPPDRHRHWAGRHPVLTGTLIGVGVGVPIGVATCRYPTAEGSSCSDWTYPGNARALGGLTMGLYGAGIGAAIGAVVGAFGR